MKYFSKRLSRYLINKDDLPDMKTQPQYYHKSLIKD